MRSLDMDDKIVIKKDSLLYKSVVVELKPGAYHDQANWSYPDCVDLTELVEAYLEWKEMRHQIAGIEHYTANFLTKVRELNHGK